MHKNDERITLLIDELTKSRLVKAAKDQDKTVSQIIRGLIKNHFQTLDSHSYQPDRPD